MKHYDLLVIGTGEAGKKVATSMNEEGWKTAIADKREYGGTCSLRGCDPKKVIRGFAEVMARANQLKGVGIAEPPKVSWSDLIEYKKTFTDDVPENTVKKLKKAGIDLYYGEVRFVDDQTVEVEGEQLQADYFVIASGAQSITLDIPGAELMTEGTDFMELTELPDKVLFVGGGYIAMEFAHMAARFGSHVTVLERESLPLEKFDPYVVEYLMKSMEGSNIDLHVNCEVMAVQKEGEHLKVKVKKEGKEAFFISKLVFNTAGRVPAIKALQLDKAGIEYDKKGVKVNEYLQSVSHPNIYACGDSASHALPLTPVGVKESEVVIANLKKAHSEKADFPVIPTIAFTLPPVARVGMTEKEAREKGLKVKVKMGDAKDWFTAKRIREPAYAYKVIIHEEDDYILGTHLVGPEVDELINAFAILINGKITTSEVKRMIFAYPTTASDIVYML